ncbi:MAG: hypothetical protein JWQ80_1244 [Massilia sp.]|nr:hypothetical protein [Massilia sp.]
MEQPSGPGTPRVLVAVQLQRNSAAEVVQSDKPLREAMLEGLRRRNAVLDALFYDVKVISPRETGTLAPWLAHEGALLIVPPTGAGTLCVCPDIDAFAAGGGAGTRILAVAVAGVGSSALGTAAFARNVADAFGEPVAALVSGYGLADMLSEAAGGHSKGNLVIAEALYALRDAHADEHLGETAIVTISAAIAMPPRYRNIIDVMGEADWFGAMNSNFGIGVEYRLKDAGQHTNTELRWHLPVREVMSALRRERGSALLH